MLRKRTIILLLLCVVYEVAAFGQSLKVLTANIWTGLDYVGQRHIGEYESPEIRERRFTVLLDELRRLKPDIVCLQEVNPISERAGMLAHELSYDYIYQRTNSGAKIGSLGLPSNLNEGMLIMARKNLHLGFMDVWDLDDGFGIIGNTLSLHWIERRTALVGKIHLGNAVVLVVNVHVSSAVPDDSETRSIARQIVTSKPRGEQEMESLINACFSHSGSRMRSIRKLLDHLNRQRSGQPVIILGDFNATPSQPEIRDFKDAGNIIDAAETVGIGGVPTWDPEANTNIRFSLQPVDANGDTLDLSRLLGAWYDRKPRRIDYIFLNDQWLASNVASCQRVLDLSRDGQYASDHYGLMSTLNVSGVTSRTGEREDEIAAAPKREMEALPILSYDTDVGLGYGAKGFFLNFLGKKESFDLILFNSTKGERWYRLAFSLPDFELRQGKLYPLSFDLVIDYDKYLKINFYGLGSGSVAQTRETYTKEPLEVSGILSRGFSREFVAQMGLKYRTVRNLNYQPGGYLVNTLPQINHGRSSALTLYGSARYDSRDSYINASRGVVAQLEVESNGRGLAGDYSVTSATLALQSYRVLFYPKTVLAVRLWGHLVEGTDLPVYMYASVGGTRTLRGYPQDRYLDKAAGVLNAEVRFPLYWRFGGVLGFDAGKVFSAPSHLALTGWACNPVAGLRLYMDTFVVRADLGFGKETTGFYLNFGQLF